MKAITLCACLWLAGAGAAQAAIYTWVDAKGVLHYSDSASSANAKRADLPGLQASEGNADALSELQAEAQRASVAANGPADGPANRGVPRSAVFTQPTEGQTIRDAQGQVPLTLTVDGSSTLQPGEQIMYYLDGSPIPNGPSTLTQLTLGNVPRGAHTISAAMLYRGRELRRTSPLTFYMDQPSAISPLNAGQGGGNANPGGVGGSTVAPPAGNASGATAAPRFNTTSTAAGAAPPS